MLLQEIIDDINIKCDMLMSQSWQSGYQEGYRKATEDGAAPAWTNSMDNLQDGEYVGILPSGGKVFVTVTDGRLYPVEYCKQLVRWCKLPD